MRVAILDLGTNTFNLLLADIQKDKTFTILHEEKQAVKIGLQGINKQIITSEATERAIHVLKHYLTMIAETNCTQILAFATSAVRSARNSATFLADVKSHTGLEVQVISGDQEAELIYQGVKQTIDIDNETALILDIGGGSNELIIANGHKIFWKHSFDLGIARIIEMFPPENPLNSNTLSKIEEYFDQELNLLWTETRKYSLQTLIGSSGSFDTYRALLTAGQCGNEISFNIDLQKYKQLHERLLASTTEQRLAMPGMKPLRVEMIVYASIFTNLVIKKLGLKKIIQSDYALKEGAMQYLVEGKLSGLA